MTSTTADWLLEISGLTVGARDGVVCDVVGQGQALAQQLRAAAAAHVVAGGCDGTCPPTCSLHEVDGGPAACRLAPVLASAPPDPTTLRDGRRTSRAYLRALRVAATAVFHCRRHAHPLGECWFSDDGTDVCGDVLAVAHRIGA